MTTPSASWTGPTHEHDHAPVPFVEEHEASPQTVSVHVVAASASPGSPTSENAVQIAPRLHAHDPSPSA